jgi:hypothetical protein
VLSVSATGMAVYREVAPLALGYERELLAALTADQRAALDRALDALTSRAQSLAGAQHATTAPQPHAGAPRTRRSR